MKKRIAIFTITMAVLTILSLSLCYGDEITTSMSGPDLLRAKDTVSITYSIFGVDCYGFQGNISYNSELMTLVSAKALQDQWVIELTGEGRFLAYSKNPMDESTVFSGGDIFTFEFLIDEETAAGNYATLDLYDVIATDSESEYSVPNTSYKEIIDPPASDDATISALYITNASYSPAFSPEVTEYTVPLGVGFNVTSLAIEAETTNDRASYTIEGNDLRVGNNTVTITVTAETGVQKVYTINLRRAHDPAEPLSDNTRLSQLSISSGILTPSFNPDVREYIVYLPSHITEFSANGVADDEFAKGVINSKVDLAVGVNDVIVSCKAENNVMGEYLIHVVVMPEYIGIIPTIQNSIPLTGSLEITGELELDQTLTAVLNDGLENSKYDITWYRNGEVVKTGSTYTITENDKQCFIQAKASGTGFFSGTIDSNVIAVMKNGTVYRTDRYIPSATIDIYVASFALVTLLGLASSVGIIIGIRRSKTNTIKGHK